MFKIGITYPLLWNLQRFDRIDNVIVIEPRKGLHKGNSVRVEIHVGHTQIELDQGIENMISGELSRYELSPEYLILLPTKISHPNYQFTKAAIRIPTDSFPENTRNNMMGESSSEVYQLMDMYILLNDDDRIVWVYVYKGLDEELNSQADEIIRTIQFNPSYKVPNG